MPNYLYPNYAPWYSKRDKIKKVVIENGVTNIGNMAFYDCSHLTTITIPNTVMSIGNNAFSGTAWYNNQADGLVYAGLILYKYKGTMPTNTEIVVSDGTKGITDYAFQDCSGLTSITIPNSVTHIGNLAFYGCSGLTSITIPNSVTSIGSGAFRNCSGLTSVIIPNSVTSIGVNALNGTNWYNNQPDGLVYTGLILYKYKGTMPANTKIVIKDGTKSIAESAFSGCSGLTSITIPNSVTTIESGAFSGCSGLTSITIPNSVTKIGDSAFEGCRGITSITIPNSVTSIGKQVFSGCSGLTSITIPNSVTTIESGAFSGCSGLTSITIPNSVTTIESGAFSGCSGLTSITIPNSVTTIESGAFKDCYALKSVTIPNSVTYIGSSVFSNCVSLANVTIGMKNISNSFSGLDFTSVTLLDGVESIGERAFKNCSHIKTITIPESVTNIGSSAFSGCSSLSSITISENVTSIGSSAFEKCNSLTTIAIPYGVTKIEDNTFADCGSLTYATLPNSITSIGQKAFYECSSLSFVCIPNKVTSIGAYAFYNCCSLTSIFIPNSVTSIGVGSFKWCSSITSITIPNSVKSIGNEAFSGCDDLQDITINVNKGLTIGKSTFYSSVSKIEKITMIGETLPVSTESDFVSEGVYSTATLFVPSANYNKYRSTNPWKNFSKIEKNKPVVYLRDDESYTSNEQNDIEEISYTRIFSTTSWEALYIPFSISYDDWKNDFELAYIKDIRQIDDNGDNVIDRTIMDVVIIKDGDIAPNTPYLIRAKSVGNKTFTVRNSTLSKSEENCIDYSTTIAKFTFTGTYNSISTETLKANNYYIMADGSLKKADEANELLPYRWYMKAESRNSSYNISDLAKMISVNVVEEGATGVKELRMTNESSTIYDLNGRMVNEKYLKSGLHIKNGKKVVVK